MLKTCLTKNAGGCIEYERKLLELEYISEWDSFISSICKENTAVVKL